jgi:formylmethanofuran dehydrogenase subunit C
MKENLNNKGVLMSNVVGNINVDGDKVFYSPDFKNLNNTPSSDIFGYLMAGQGITIHNAETDVVGELYKLRGMSTTYASYIDTILENIIVYGDIEDYMGHLSDEPHKFITSWGEVVDVEDLSWI